MGCSALVRRIEEAIRAVLIVKLTGPSCWTKKGSLRRLKSEEKFRLGSVPHVIDHYYA